MQTQTELGLALNQARRETDNLFRLVRPDSLYERPIPERHRIVFYIGHLEAFDLNLIGRYPGALPSFNPELDRLFAFGIDPPPGQLPSDQPSDWPGMEEVERYCRRTREAIDEALDAVPEQVFYVAMEHRLMHAETLAYMLHNLSYERKVGQAPQSPAAPGVPVPRMIEIPAGPARLGLEPGEGFGWDNEFQAHTVHVPAFSIGAYKVTNREYLDFVREGAAPPFFWAGSGGRWFYRGMFSAVPLPLDCPVYVTQREAEAYARWLGMRLPTEPEFHRAARGAPAAEANFDFHYWDPIPVNTGEPAAGLPDAPRQMTGNGWEWTSTVFAPFEGFEPFPFYPNYSAPFFDGQHYVLKGASPRTAACFLRPSFRNWFRLSYPYVYGTFRLVAS